MQSLTVSGARVSGSRLTFDLEGGPAEEVWFETQAEYAPWLVSDRYDAALVSLVPYAMKTGRRITVRGGVTGPLLHALRTGVIPILRGQLPSLNSIDIDAEILPTPSAPAKSVLTGLSCGVDSLSTIRTFKNHESEELRITHLGFFNVGSHWVNGGTPAQVYAARLSRVRQAASELGLPLIEVTGNITESFWAPRFAQHHTLWNCAVSMALGVKTYLYSSAVPYREIAVRPVTDTAYADPILLPLLASSGVACISANAEMQRVEKTELIADWPYAQRWLDVCEAPGPDGRNCSACGKCCRTLLTLEILGKLPAFASVFDLEKYEAGKSEYIAYIVWTGKTPFAREILELAKRRKVDIVRTRHRLKAWRKAAIALARRYAPPWLDWRLGRMQGNWSR